MNLTIGSIEGAIANYAQHSATTYAQAQAQQQAQNTGAFLIQNPGILGIALLALGVILKSVGSVGKFLMIAGAILLILSLIGVPI